MTTVPDLMADVILTSHASQAADAERNGAEFAGPEHISILGVPVSLVTVTSATQRILGWVKSRDAGRYVCVRDVHGVMLAQDDGALLKAHRDADMVTPDGMPLAFIARRRHPGMVGRTCGADLFAELLREGLPAGTRHFFFGGKPGVAEELARIAVTRNPGLIVAGTATPPFGPLSLEEDAALTRRVADAAPDIVWVGLSTPKQELWMADHRQSLPGAVLIGVGAVFDFYIGAVRRAPLWASNAGLEWLFRLASEPRRLWRRYLILAPRFVLRVALERRRGKR